MMGRLRRLFRALPSNRKRDVWVTLTLMALSAVADGGAVIALSRALNGLAGPDAKTDGALIFGLLILLAGLLRLATNCASQHLGSFASRDLIVTAHRHWLDQPYAFHLQRHSAQLLASPERIEQAVFGLLLPAMQAFAAILSTLAVLVALVAVDAIAAAIMLAALLAVFGSVAALLRGILVRNGSDANLAYERRIKTMQESQGAVRDIILDRTQSWYQRRLTEASDAIARSGMATSLASTLPRQIVETGGIIAVMVLALFLSSTDQGFVGGLPALGALALAGQRLLPAVQSLFQGWANATAAAPMVDEALWLVEMSTPTDVADSATPDFDRTVELAGISFNYPGIGSAAVRDVDIRIEKGQRLVITGPSGAGKSTLADLLMGLLEPASGVAFIDGRTVGPDSLQRLFSHVPQDPFFADQTLADAITAWRHHDPARLSRSIDLAGLTALVAKLPEGPDTMLGEHGIRLSGGERQRIALARAIYREAPILILDEATSAVDDEAEQQILDSLDRLQAGGTTIIIIAHRGGALSRAGHRIRLHRGRLCDESDGVAPSLEHQH